MAEIIRDPLYPLFAAEHQTILFIEVKNESKLGEKYPALSNLPLPIPTSYLKEQLEDKESDGVPFDTILNGIALLIAIDSQFYQIPSYLALLEEMKIDFYPYLKAKAANYYQEGNQEAIYYYRTLYLLNQADDYGTYAYAELLYQRYHENKNEHYRDESIELLEGLITKSPSFALSYTGLGKIFEDQGFYLKAESYYHLALKHTEDRVFKDEIRLAEQGVYTNARIEKAKEFLAKINYEEALREITDAKKQDTDPVLDFYLGLIYSRTGQLSLAVDALEKAYAEGIDYKILFLELSNVYYKKGSLPEAIQTCTIGLLVYPDDLDILYNRALCYITGNANDMAKKDLDLMLEYGDLSDDMFNEVMILKETYDL